MRITNEDTSLLPDDEIFLAAVISIEQRTFTWTDRKDPGHPVEKEGQELVWKWEIQEGPYKTRWAFGSTRTRVGGTNNPLLDWVEALYGRSLAVGEEFDTDDLIGMIANITVRHETSSKGKPYATVDTVSAQHSALQQAAGRPAADPWASVAGNEPPF
jgi:hypothetical protein